MFLCFSYRYMNVHIHVTEHDRSSLLSILLARQLDRCTVTRNAFILMNIVLPVPSRRATYPRFVCFVHQRAVFIEPRDKQQQSNDSRNPLLLFSWEQQKGSSTKPGGWIYRMVEYSMQSPWFATLSNLKTSEHRVNERWFFGKYHVCKRNLVDPSCIMKVPSSTSRFRSVTTLNWFWSY